MKTVITSTGNNKHSKFDLRFGRAAWFCFYDENTGEMNFEKNENPDAQSGAGTKSAEKMVEQGVSKVISGDFGPKARDLLNKFGIQMVIIQDDNQTIEDILNMLN